MIPVILQSHTEEKVQQWTDEYKQQHRISAHFVYEIRPEKIELSIDQIRAVKRELIVAMNQLRLFILYSFDNATLEAQNALLKTLEEKNEHNQFVLVCQNAARIIPTIRSRVRLIELDEKNHIPGVSPETKAVLGQVERAGYAFMGAKRIQAISREDGLVFIDEMIQYLREKMKKDQPALAGYLKTVLETKELYLNNNLNAQLTIDTLLLQYKRKVAKD